jgi:mannose-6-phosphate isomerase-like protein (cupin superfamily)
MRRVVTGEDEQGRSVVVQDGEPPHSVFLASTGFREHAVWHVELPLAASNGGGDPVGEHFQFPPPAGSATFMRAVVPPRGTPVEVDALIPEARSKMPGLLEVSDDSRGPGMHRTETVDMLVIVSGEVDLVLEAQTVRLRAGDCVVQRGTWHAWENPGDEPCVIAGLMVASGG